MALEQVSGDSRKRIIISDIDIRGRIEEARSNGRFFEVRSISQAESDLPALNEALSRLIGIMAEMRPDSNSKPTHRRSLGDSKRVIDATIDQSRHRQIAQTKGYDQYFPHFVKKIKQAYYEGRRSVGPLPEGLKSRAHEAAKTTTRSFATREVDAITGIDNPKLEEARLELYMMGATEIVDVNGLIGVHFPLKVGTKSYLWCHREGLTKPWLFHDWADECSSFHPIPKPTLGYERRNEEQERIKQEKIIADAEIIAVANRMHRTPQRQAALELEFERYLKLEEEGNLNLNMKNFGEKYSPEIKVYNHYKTKKSHPIPETIVKLDVPELSYKHNPISQPTGEAGLRAEAKESIDRYQTSISRQVRKRHDNFNPETAADAIAPLHDAIHMRQETRRILSGDKLGIFSHPEKAAGQRMEVFFQGIIDRASILQDAIRESIYSNSSYLRRINSLLGEDLPKTDLLLLLQSPFSVKNNYTTKRAHRYNQFSSLVRSLTEVLDVTTDQKQKYLRSKKEHLETFGYYHNPFSPNHGKPINLKTYGFEHYAVFDVFMMQNYPSIDSHSKSPLSLRFGWAPLPFASYHNKFRSITKMDDLMPDEARQIMQQTARQAYNISEIETMIEEARDTLLVPSFEVAISEILDKTEHGIPVYKDYAKLRGELYEINEGETTRICLNFQADGFPEFNTRMTIARRRNGARRTITDTNPPLQRYLEDFRGLYI